MNKILVTALGFVFILSSSICLSVSKERNFIFTKEYMSEKFRSSLRPWPYSYWTPERNQIQNIDIKEYLLKNNFQVKLKPLEEYTFQFYGIEENNKKNIIIQAVCASENRDFEKVLYIVLGGGNCYFNLSYDTETKQLSGFYINATK